jgi:hypothetical protein
METAFQFGFNRGNSWIICVQREKRKQKKQPGAERPRCVAGRAVLNSAAGEEKRMDEHDPFAYNKK